MNVRACVDAIRDKKGVVSWTERKWRMMMMMMMMGEEI